jgi:hypothetical protein
VTKRSISREASRLGRWPINSSTPVAESAVETADRIDRCKASAQFTRRRCMRKTLAFGLAAFLMASPAMAQVVIGGDNDAARHEQRAQQDRMAAQKDAMQAQRDAAMGNYPGAAREQRESHQEWRDANHQDRKADRDDHGVTVQLGH